MFSGTLKDSYGRVTVVYLCVGQVQVLWLYASTGRKKGSSRREQEREEKKHLGKCQGIKENKHEKDERNKEKGVEEERGEIEACKETDL